MVCLLLTDNWMFFAFCEVLNFLRSLQNAMFALEICLSQLNDFCGGCPQRASSFLLNQRSGVNLLLRIPSAFLRFTKDFTTSTYFWICKYFFIGWEVLHREICQDLTMIFFGENLGVPMYVHGHTPQCQPFWGDPILLTVGSIDKVWDPCLDYSKFISSQTLKDRMTSQPGLSITLGFAHQSLPSGTTILNYICWISNYSELWNFSLTPSETGLVFT